jgi:hypothetical protein
VTFLSQAEMRQVGDAVDELDKPRVRIFEAPEVGTSTWRATSAIGIP